MENTLDTMKAFVQYMEAKEKGLIGDVREYNPRQRGSFFHLGDLLGRNQKTRNEVKTLMRNYTQKALGANTKHTGIGNTNAMTPPLNEQSFFIDCELEAPVINATLSPMESLLSVLETRANRNRLISTATITTFGANRSAPDSQAAECDPATEVALSLGACKLQLGFGKRQSRTSTGDSNELVFKACRGIYEDFFFIGDIRGVTATPFQEFTPNDRDLIVRGAVMNALAAVGKDKQLWLQRTLWSGDPANNVGQDIDFWGFDRLINDNYPASGLPLTGLNDINDCSINSDVKNFADECIGGTESIWQLVQELEDTIYRRAKLAGLLPLEAVWVMRPEHWYEFSKAVPCEMVGDGCNGGVVNANDGGGGLFNLTTRQQMQDSMSLRVNGRLYRVILDDAIPYTFAQPNPQQITASIYFIPLRGAGQLLTFVDYKDYSVVDQVMQPIPATRHMQGWTDAGRFHNIIQEKLWCFEVTSKCEPRLVFKAPQLAGRIDNVIACPLQVKPTAHPEVGTDVTP